MKRIVPIAIGILVFACGSTSDGGTMDADKPVGRSIFNTNCALCHGRDGKASLNGAKDLTISTLSKPEMKAIVREGKGAMAPYKNVLSAQEIEAVVEHVRSLGKSK